MRHYPPLVEGPETLRDEELRFRRAQNQAILELVRVQALVDRLARDMFAHMELVGITPAQSNVLMVLFHAEGPVTARDLHRVLGVTEVTISRFVASLEKHGWVARQRSPNDGRAMLIEPTTKARDALHRFIHTSNGLLDAAFHGFEREELGQLRAVVERITSNLEAALPQSN